MNNFNIGILAEIDITPIKISPMSRRDIYDKCEELLSKNILKDNDNRIVNATKIECAISLATNTSFSLPKSRCDRIIRLFDLYL